MKALVLDKFSAATTAYRLMLEDLGYSVVILLDALQVQQYFEEHPGQVGLLLVCYESCIVGKRPFPEGIIEIAEKQEALVVLMTTGANKKNIDLLSVQVSALVKPFSFDHLISAIQVAQWLKEL